MCGPSVGADAANVSKHTAFASEARALCVPSGDRDYYLFREAGKPFTLPTIQVYAIAGGTVSFDLSRRGRTEFHIFDSNDFCISDLSCGATPFIAEQKIEVKGSLGILDDVHSSAMSLCSQLAAAAVLCARLPIIASISEITSSGAACCTM